MSDILYENGEKKAAAGVVADIDLAALQPESFESSTHLNLTAAAATHDKEFPPPQRQAEDGGWGWVVVVGSSICHFFLLGLARTLGIVFILLQEKFGASAKETALVTSIFVSIRACGGERHTVHLNRT